METEDRPEIHVLVLFRDFLRICLCDVEKSVKAAVYRYADHVGNIMLPALLSGNMLSVRRRSGCLELQE